MPPFDAAMTLTDANRPIRLRLAYGQPMLADVLLVQHVSGIETICGGIDYSLLCVSTRAGLALKQFIAVPAEIQFVTDTGDLRSVCGIVVAAMEGQSDGGLATYRLVVRDALSMLDQTCNTRVFRNQNEVDITHTLLKEWRLANPVAGRAFEYSVGGLKPYPARAFTMQYNESTGAFLRRLWKRRGIAWFIKPGSVTSSGDAVTPVHTLVLFDNATTLRKNAAGAVRFHRDGATESRDTITAWHGIRTLTPASVHRCSWDYKQAGAFGSADTSVNNQGMLGQQCAASLDDYLVDAPHTGHDGPDYQSLGLARMLRHEYEAKCFQGEGSDRTMRVGEWNMVTGHPEIDAHPPQEREFVITELQVEADNNLPKEVDEKVRKLFQLNHWCTVESDLVQASATRGTRYANRFTCVRRGIQIVPKYDPRIDLPRTEMQYVTVVGPANQEIYCDERARVKIRFPGCRPDDHADGAGASGTDRDSAWVQVASPWAGMQYGAISLPRVGDQVLCAFIGGDPDKPLIIGRAHSGATPPPKFSRVSQLPGDKYLSGIVSREGSGASKGDYSQRYNQLRMDDTPGQISAQLSSAHGQSQLNLGYLTHPRANGTAMPRGAGFELATNDSGAVRTARALLLSAWKRIDACGTQMDNAEHLVLMQECLDLFKTLGQYAAAHQGIAVDDAPQSALKSDLDAGNGAEAPATLSVTAPAGLALSTPAAIVSYAGKNIDSVAQQHMQLTSGARLHLHSGKALSLFAQSDGITQVAHKGKFLMQSQHDDMQFDAAKDLKATAGGRVVVMAEDEITFIVSGGAYLTLKGGTAEIGGPGAMTIKTDGHHWNGPASGKTELPVFTEGDFSRIPRLLRATDGKPVEGMQLHVARAGDGPLSGRSNAAGEGETVKADHLQQLTATFFKPLK
jgi:type VI secretion system secreted protein VgrG